MHNRRAFTLVELLIVIAIIAILAAILFPVFAAARESARKTACLSNTRQIGTAMITYLSDYDETLPSFTSYCDGARVDNPLAPASADKPRPMWQWKIYPYLKNWQVYTCPSDTAAPASDPLMAFYNISYGFNYGYLGTLTVPGDNGGPDEGCPDTPYWFAPKAMSSVVRPAEIVMVAETGGTVFPSATTMGSAVNPPDAANSNNYFFAPPPGGGGGGQLGWGLNCQNWWVGTKWADTDGFAWRHQDGGNVIMVDGHAKWYKPAILAVGTSYDPQQSCLNTQVTDPTVYHWDPSN